MRYCIAMGKTAGRLKAMPKAGQVSVRGAVLVRLRESAGYTQGELAYHAGVDQSTISRLENAERADARLSTVAALAQALSCTVAELTGEPAPPTVKVENLAPDLQELLRRAEGLSEHNRQEMLRIAELLHAEQEIKRTREEMERRRKTLEGRHESGSGT